MQSSVGGFFFVKMCIIISLTAVEDNRGHIVCATFCNTCTITCSGSNKVKSSMRLQLQEIMALVPFLASSTFMFALQQRTAQWHLRCTCSHMFRQEIIQKLFNWKLYQISKYREFVEWFCWKDAALWTLQKSFFFHIVKL